MACGVGSPDEGIQADTLQPSPLPAIIASMQALIKSMRPLQWAKNGFIFAALIFDRQLLSFTPFLRTLAGFILLCLASSAVYLVNDIADAEADRSHPQKRNRPIASGALSVGVAGTAAGILFAVSLAAGFALNWKFGLVVLTYLILNLLYSLFLKNIVIIDAMSVGISFVLRALGGALAVDVPASKWLLINTLLLALFLSFGKRRHELVLLEDGAADHRKILSKYSPYLLDQCIGVTTASVVVMYMLYSFSTEVSVKLGTENLFVTIPFVVYGVFRYLYLIHKEEKGGSPTRVMITDRPILIDILLWMATVFVILYL